MHILTNGKGSIANNSNATSNGNPGIYGAGGGGGGAPTEDNNFSGMTTGSGSAGTVIIRYRIG